VDPFEHLEPYEQEALLAWEKKFRPAEFSERPFGANQPVAVERIFGTFFALYDRPVLSGKDPDLIVADVSFYLYSESNRHKLICEHIMNSWWPELDRVLDLMQEWQNTGHGSELEWQSLSFGFEGAGEDYILHLSSGQRIVASSEFIHNLLRFLVAHLAPELEYSVPVAQGRAGQNSPCFFPAD